MHSKNTVRRDGKKQEAQTKYTPLFSNGRYTLAKVDPITGRKHQIRAHALHIGHSIVGDKLYGPDEGLFLDFIADGWTKEMAEVLPLNRHALHAYRMVFHLEDGPESYVAPLSQDLVAFCSENLGLAPAQLDGIISSL